MGLFDKIKKFAGGKNMATVEVTGISGVIPGQAQIKVSDGSIHGSMTTVAQEDCTLIATAYEIILRTKDEEGEWSDDFVAFGKDKETRDLAAGEQVSTNFIVSDVEIAKHLRNRDWNPNDAVGNDSIKLIVKCIADVKGSPFDPSGEAEVALAPQAAMSVEITNIEGDAPDVSSFPVTDSVLKGTVVVTANEEAVLAATKYEILLRIDGKEVIVANEQDPELEPDALSVSFGGTYIDFPLQMKCGKKATHTWMVSDIDLAKALAQNGFADPSEAAHDDRVALVVRCLADIDGQANVAMSETHVSLRS